MKRKKVTTDDLRAIKANETKVFYVPTPRDIQSARSMAYTLTKVEPELGIRFRTWTDFDELKLTITAEKV